MAKKASQAPENKLSENIGSIILGFVVVLILGGFLLNVFRGNKNGEVGESGETEEQQQEETAAEGNKYTVQQGDTLWSIAESQTGSGYNWESVANANNLSSPDEIEVGMELTIPKIADIVTPEELTEELPDTNMTEESESEQPSPTVVAEESMETQPASGNYVVQKGDNLWKIAIAQYNDGYRWVDIARTNNLNNPNLIHAGNVLILP